MVVQKRHSRPRQADKQTSKFVVSTICVLVARNNCTVLTVSSSSLATVRPMVFGWIKSTNSRLLMLGPREQKAIPAVFVYSSDVRLPTSSYGQINSSRHALTRQHGTYYPNVPALVIQSFLSLRVMAGQEFNGVFEGLTALTTASAAGLQFSASPGGQLQTADMLVSVGVDRTTSSRPAVEQRRYRLCLREVLGSHVCVHPDCRQAAEGFTESGIFACRRAERPLPREIIEATVAEEALTEEATGSAVKADATNEDVSSLIKASPILVQVDLPILRRDADLSRDDEVLVIQSSNNAMSMLNVN
ncbi:unnamed protein product [Protopolystoma xenopodis]|uniref:Uncharacterized protein n=1 Tax=Protopolystoma xenopodis TaxID=117903 RepID=A0A448WD34_9PLAT|nr:unnamed protein product [Protopolystoma xenopodis]